MRKLLVTAFAVLAASGCAASVPESPDEAEPPSSRAPDPSAGGAAVQREAVGTAASDYLWWPPPPPIPPPPFAADDAPAGGEDTGTATSDFSLPQWVTVLSPPRPLPHGGIQGTSP